MTAQLFSKLKPASLRRSQQEYLFPVPVLGGPVQAAPVILEYSFFGMLSWAEHSGRRPPEGVDPIAIVSNTNAWSKFYWSAVGCIGMRTVHRAGEEMVIERSRSFWRWRLDVPRIKYDRCRA
jgi:hypothetical protein